jgi:hypothetical protein
MKQTCFKKTWVFTIIHLWYNKNYTLPYYVSYAWKSHILWAALYFHVWPIFCLYSSRLSHVKHDFREKSIKTTYVVLFPPQLSPKYSEFCEEFSEISHMKNSFMQGTVILSERNGTWNFSTDFPKILKYEMSLKPD